MKCVKMKCSPDCNVRILFGTERLAEDEEEPNDDGAEGGEGEEDADDGGSDAAGPVCNVCCSLTIAC